MRDGGHSCCYAADNHLSAEGNRGVAAWVVERLAPPVGAARGGAGG